MLSKQLTPSIRVERVWSQLMQLSQIRKQESGGVTHTSLSPEDLEARKLLINWFEEAGLEVTIDGAGNIIGRLRGMDDSLPPVMTGSHIDSVLNGGKFDGPLGVLGALEVVRTLKENGIRFKRAIEVVSFTDEEGARFSAGFIGSKGMCGLLQRHDLDRMVDGKEITYDEAFRQAGLSPDLYVVGLVLNCSSVVQMAQLVEKDELLKAMFQPWKLAQYTLSCFFSNGFAWTRYWKKTN